MKQLDDYSYEIELKVKEPTLYTLSLQIWVCPLEEHDTFENYVHTFQIGKSSTKYSASKKFCLMLHERENDMSDFVKSKNVHKRLPFSLVLCISILQIF